MATASPASTEASKNPKKLESTERITEESGAMRGPFGGGMVGQKATTFAPSSRRLLRRLRPYRWRLLFSVVAAAISVVAGAFGPIALGWATDIVYDGIVDNPVVGVAGIDKEALASVLFIAIGLFLLSSLTSFTQGYLLNDVIQGSMRTLRSDVEDTLNTLPLGYFDRQPRGELLSRVTNDIDNLSQSLQQTMQQMLRSAFQVLAVIVMMVWLSPLLALIAIVSIPIGGAVAGVVMRRSRQRFIERWRRTGALNAQIEEAFTGHALTKVFGRRRESQRRFDEENEQLFQAAFSAQFLSSLIMPIMTFVGNLNYVAIAVIGAWRVTAGAMSLGGVQAFIQLSRQFSHPVSHLASMANLMQSGVASAERVFELLDAEPEVADVGHGLPSLTGGETEAASQTRSGRVAFDKVSFSYDPNTPLIENLSLVVEPGQTAAIVGPTGAGKTTLVNLIMRFYELDGGRITIDEIDITEKSRHELRSQIGMVLQDTWLFVGSIRDNIAYGRPGATEEEILTAARATFVDRFVRNLPDGYDTIIDDEGSNISAGQKQLITIARAFLADPALLILDEATSSVDTRTEALVQEAMAALRSDRTSFVIAHRLSTIRDADLILVMDGGRIVEQGDHAALLRAGGAYAALYNTQFAGKNLAEHTS